jgi:hypothetical protein
MRKNKALNKINLQCLNIFEYYLNELFPSILKGYQKIATKSQHLSTEHRGIVYRYACSCTELSKEPTAANVLEAARATYFQDTLRKIDDHRALKQKNIQMRMMPVQRDILDQVDLLLQNELDGHE